MMHNTRAIAPADLVRTTGGPRDVDSHVYFSKLG
jgi:hypothetical protein